MTYSFLGSSLVKNLPANVGDSGLTLGRGRSTGGGNDNPFQYSCLGNPMNKEAWWAIVYGDITFVMLTVVNTTALYI